mmetsp:Transcript_68631/g.135782  ORF Transcript_68631/g.135782 Transcript_68631/m.135782 type:complete len:262 (-) Transcript_68631:22-807(-)
MAFCHSLRCRLLSRPLALSASGTRAVSSWPSTCSNFGCRSPVLSTTPWTPQLNRSLNLLSHAASTSRTTASATVARIDSEVLTQLAQDILNDKALATRLSATPAAAQLLAVRLGKDNAEALEIPEPTVRQMRIYALHHIIPFIGFGFFDNAIMILAGDFFDSKLGIAFGVTTMCSAAFGNMISDICGLWVAGFVETCAAALGLPDHGLSNEQQKILKIRILKNTSMVFGISLGCLLGMFPLIYPKEWRLWPSRDKIMSMMS